MHRCILRRRGSVALASAPSIYVTRTEILKHASASTRYVGVVRGFGSDDDDKKPPSSSKPPTAPLGSFRPRRKTSDAYRPIPTRTRKSKGPYDPFGMDGSRAHLEPPYDVPPAPNIDFPIKVDKLPGEYPPDYKGVFGSKTGDIEYDLPKIQKEQLEKHVLNDPLVQAHGVMGAELFRHIRRERENPTSVENDLRSMDYLIAESGSTEERVLSRRMMMEATDSEEERKEFEEEMNDFMEKIDMAELELGNDDLPEVPPEVYENAEEEEVHSEIGKSEWADLIVKVDRVQKVQRGGTKVRYRALVVGGNTRGVAGFGVGKANGPKEAVEAASRKAKRNIFFVDRFRNRGLSHDIVGRHNSCKVAIRTVSPNYGLTGHPLIQDILTFFGITDATAKSHGNRNPYNVVYATFKAIMTHESVEDIAIKRGRRLISVERARKMDLY